MEWNEPIPERVSGIQKSRPDGYNRVLRQRGDNYIFSPQDMMVGYFPPDMQPKRLQEIRQRGIIKPLGIPKRCPKCSDYMQLKKGFSDRYTCRGKCQDTRAIRFIKKQQVKMYLQRTPETKHIVGVKLNPNWIRA